MAKCYVKPIIHHLVTTSETCLVTRDQKTHKFFFQFCSQNKTAEFPKGLSKLIFKVVKTVRHSQSKDRDRFYASYHRIRGGNLRLNSRLRNGQYYTQKTIFGRMYYNDQSDIRDSNPRLDHSAFYSAF